jgi:hypothetical protein
VSLAKNYVDDGNKQLEEVSFAFLSDAPRRLISFAPPDFFRFAGSGTSEKQVANCFDVAMFALARVVLDICCL